MKKYVITEDTPCNPVTEYGKTKLKVKDTVFQNTLVMSCTDRMLKNEAVTLNSVVDKTEEARGFISDHSFDDAIRRVVRIKKGTDNPFGRGIDWFLVHIPNKFIRFCFVGCLNAAFGYGVYCLSILLGASVWLSVLISNILGVMWNFVTTGNLVFENKDKKLIVKFVLCYVVNYFINTGAVYSFGSIGCNDYWAGLLATPVAAICSFFMLKYLVYRK